MKNLKIIKNNFFLIILLLFSGIIYSEENKIIFKIDNLEDNILKIKIIVENF